MWRVMSRIMLFALHCDNSCLCSVFTHMFPQQFHWRVVVTCAVSLVTIMIHYLPQYLALIGWPGIMQCSHWLDYDVSMQCVSQRIITMVGKHSQCALGYTGTRSARIRDNGYNAMHIRSRTLRHTFTNFLPQMTNEDIVTFQTDKNWYQEGGGGRGAGKNKLFTVGCKH